MEFFKLPYILCLTFVCSQPYDKRLSFDWKAKVQQSIPFFLKTNINFHLIHVMSTLCMFSCECYANSKS